MPELIGRLILATASGGIEQLHFPSGDSIATGGWDGLLKVTTGTPFFPSGVSGWEIGTGVSCGNKAEEDYEKRTEDPLGLQPNESAFVFVTPRAWRNREKWQTKMRAAGAWKAVWALNAVSLEQWLDAAPAVSLWLARQIGKVTSSAVQDVENVWTEWSLTTTPAMTIHLGLAGRAKDAEAIQTWLSGTPATLPVQGDTPDEAIAFLYGAIATMPHTERERMLSRCVVVQDVSSFRELTAAFRDYPLIIAGPGECVDPAGAAVAAGHHIFLAMDAKIVDTGRIVRLSRPRRKTVEEALQTSGLSEVEARRLARDSGRSLPVLRRQLSAAGAVRTPSWGTAKVAQALLPALLAGAWTDTKDGDREVMETLAGMSYSKLIQQLMPFLSTDDAPLRKVGSVWMMKSPLDAWFILAQHVNNDLLKRFQQSIASVLTRTNPKYDLPAGQRWAAAIHGKSSHTSEWMRAGLVESLVLLAVYGNRASQMTSTQAFTDRLVEDIFGNATNWEAWASLSDVMPVLAEASPESFTDIVDETITASPNPFITLLQDDPAGVLGECRHSGLLWALEGIAWSSQYFAGAVRVLARLAAIDPGGQWSNRPAHSLGEIFHPQLPQTYATPEERLAILDVLIEEHPQIAWQFTNDYWHGGTITESHRFRWRDAGGTRSGLEPEDSEDRSRYLKGLLPKMTEIACHRKNVIAAVRKFSQLPTEVRRQLTDTLEGLKTDAFSKAEQSALCNAIREALHWINSYGDGEGEAHVTTLNALLTEFSPVDPLERVEWLLSNPWPQLPDAGPPRLSGKDAQARITEAQTAAARQLLDHVSLARILDFAKSSDYPGLLGYALGRAVSDEAEDARVLDALAADAAAPRVLIQGYARGRVVTAGSAWTDAQIMRLKATAIGSAELFALLCLGLPEGATTWAAVSALGPDVEHAYWEYASGYSQADMTGEAPIAVTKLLDAGRPNVALAIAGAPGVEITSGTLQRVVQELSADPAGGAAVRVDTMMRYYLAHVFRQLNERRDLPDTDIAALEWPFAASFDDLHQHKVSSLAIHRVLQADPTFFAQLVTFVSRRDDGVPDPRDEGIDGTQLERRARNADDVLRSWSLLPGLKADGSVDQQELGDWIVKAREQCAAEHHVRGGDLRIAFLLARAPADADGIWPHVAVRNVIEQLGNPLIDKHIRVGVLNSRGVVSRAHGEGGEQERGLGKRYTEMSNALKVQWPRTAGILRRIARSYEADATYEDVDADLDDLRWG